MRSRLHTRLASFLFALLLVLAVVATVSTLWTSRAYERETQQRLNADLAANIVGMEHELFLAEDGALRRDGLGDIFHWLMVVNPDVELYLLDRDGRLLVWDAPPGTVQRERVELAPVLEQIASGGERVPLLGDDPRHPGRRKVFSASPIPAEGPVAGYLYIILASEQAATVGERVAGSVILKRSLGLAVVSFLLAAVAGLFFSRWLTRPLQRLGRRMRSLRASDEALVAPTEGDELVQLERAFEEMATRIDGQVEEIRRIEGSRRELIANVSHDLRTPMASIRGYLETLVLKDGQLADEDRRRYLGIALRQAERLATLLDELFELAKLEAARFEPQRERFSLAELVQDNLQRYALVAEAQGVRLEGQLQPDTPFVDADVGLMDRVLQNLIENALRFTPRDGSVTVAVEEAAGTVGVEVSDTGCGIAEGELPLIFDRFYRCQFDAAESDGGGTGLGLAIAKRIMDLHESKITVRSRLGEGTIFHFALPAA